MDTARVMREFGPGKKIYIMDNCVYLVDGGCGPGHTPGNATLGSGHFVAFLPLSLGLSPVRKACACVW